jgi:hypothetical protein
MKNIHIIPTDKPTSIFKSGNNLLFSIMNKVRTNHEGFHIYITSDEDINENDYIIAKDGRLVQVSYLLSKDLEGASKVILTTDKELIQYGIQAIDDDSIEWFVKNPSCEFVEVELKTKQLVKPYDVYNEIVSYHKIIIPKEEPKQETLEEAADLWSTDTNNVHVADSYVTKYGFIEGAKWQQERMYSEEEVIAIVEKSRETGLTVEYLFLTEQFKKK